MVMDTDVSRVIYGCIRVMMEDTSCRLAMMPALGWIIPSTGWMDGRNTSDDVGALDYCS